MKFHNTSARNKGFTIVEVLVALGIAVMLLGLALPFTVTYYRKYKFDGEKRNFISFLRIARNLSMNSVDSSNHGLYLGATEYVIFTGNSYATRDQSKDLAYSRDDEMSISGPSEIVFRGTTGMTSSVSFTLSSTISTTTSHVKILINKEGAIDWQ